jgi:hypothetical protein
MDRAVVASTRLRATADCALDVVRSDPLAAFGGPRLALAANLPGVPAIRHDIDLEVGPVVCLEGAVAVPVRWCAAGREALFPRFAGELVVGRGEGDVVLRLHGAYTVPFGAVGGFGDGLVGRRIARRCIEDLVVRVATAIDAAVTPGATSDDHCYEVTVTEARCVEGA